MNVIRQYFSFVQAVFSWQYLPILGFGVFATIGLVVSGLDWQYLLLILEYVPRTVLYVADGLGYLIPILTIACLGLLFVYTKQAIYLIYTLACMYAIILGLTLSMTLKAFTGRTSPPHHHGLNDSLILIDNSHDFQFGFMREHILGGWPSSHTTVMFALATALFLLLPRRWYITILLYGTALFISLGVSFGWHWLSEFVAGTCLGVTIGIVVGTHYQQYRA